MEICISKYFDKSELKCTRTDGTSNTSLLGPSFAAHDIAHYVIEKHFHIKKGFFGQIAAGKTIQMLSDPAHLRKVEPELWLSEILTRNLQNLLSGGSSIEDYIQLIQWECTNMNIACPVLSKEDVESLLSQYKVIMNQYHALGINQSILLQFDS